MKSVTHASPTPFTDELYAAVPPHRVMAELLGVDIRAKGETRVPCVRPQNHTHGDRNPNLSINGELGVYWCHCGAQGDAVQLVVELALASDAASAIRFLREKYHVNGLRTSVHPKEPAPETADVGFPPHPRTAAKLNWVTVERHGRPMLAKPVFDEKFAQCATKIRGARGKDGKLPAYLEPHGGRREPGLIGDVPALEAVESGALVLLVAGGTDLLEIKYAAECEGIELRVVSHSNGEGAALDARARLLSGLRVGVVYDVDDAGRKGAAARVEELLAARATHVADVELPFSEAQRRNGCKDLRDWLTRCGGSARELLRLVDRAMSDGVRTGTELLDAFRAGEIRRRPVLVVGLMRRGDILIFFGPPGMGKSQLALAVAVCLSLGRDVVRFIIEDDVSPLWEVLADAPLRVLFVNGEDDEADLAERLSAYLTARGLPQVVLNLLVYTPKDDERNLVAERARDRLEKLVVEHRAEVIVVDNLTNVCAGLKKNEEAEVSGWINRVPRRLRDRHGVTSILLGHANKGTADGDARSALDRLFGSMAWGACADNAVMLDWVPGEPKLRRFIHAKSRGFETFPTTRVEAAKGDCVFPVVGADETSSMPRTGRPRKATLFGFRDALTPAGTWHGRTALCSSLDLVATAFRDNLREWKLALGDELEERGGTKGAESEYRLRPLDERAARAPNLGGA